MMIRGETDICKITEFKQKINALCKSLVSTHLSMKRYLCLPYSKEIINYERPSTETDF